MPNIVTEYAEAICADCLNIIVNADPDNMGWTPRQYDEWVSKFDTYCEGVELHICPADYNDPETEPYFTHSGCPICSDGLGCDVYPVMVFAFTSKAMFEITWPEAVEIAKRRASHASPAPLFVVFNGANGDFASLKTLGIDGVVTKEMGGDDWFVDAGSAHVYLHDGATVWVG